MSGSLVQNGSGGTSWVPNAVPTGSIITLASGSKTNDRAGDGPGTALSLGALTTTVVDASDWVGANVLTTPPTPLDPYDYYQFTVSALANVTLIFGNFSDSSGVVPNESGFTLYGSNGTTVLAWIYDNPTGSVKVEQLLAAGTYYTVVSRQHFFSVAPDRCHVTVTRVSDSGDLRGFGDARR